VGLDEIDSGIRFPYRHAGFRGIEGVVMSQVLGRVRRTMLARGLPAVLDEHGHLRPGKPVSGRDLAGMSTVTARSDLA
jgi:hypothetical protein